MSKKATTKAAAAAPKVSRKRRVKVPRWLRAVGGYFTGSWQELKQVRWTNRRETWGMTLAVTLFSLFFAGLILGLDSLFHYLFKEILL